MVAALHESGLRRNSQTPMFHNPFDQRTAVDAEADTGGHGDDQLRVLRPTLD
jgi:hypothetical protein